MTGISVSAEPEAESEVEIFDTLLADLKKLSSGPDSSSVFELLKRRRAAIPKGCFSVGVEETLLVIFLVAKPLV